MECGEHGVRRRAERVVVSLVSCILVAADTFSFAGATCNNDQKLSCGKAVAESTLSLLSGGGECVAKEYVHFTHMCTVNNYLPTVDFCCCPHEVATPSAAETGAMCCRYHQDWNHFRCLETDDGVSTQLSSGNGYFGGLVLSLPMEVFLPAVLCPLAVVICCVFCCCRCPCGGQDKEMLLLGQQQNNSTDVDYAAIDKSTTIRHTSYIIRSRDHRGTSRFYDESAGYAQNMTSQCYAGNTNDVTVLPAAQPTAPALSDIGDWNNASGANQHHVLTGSQVCHPLLPEQQTSLQRYTVCTAAVAAYPPPYQRKLDNGTTVPELLPEHCQVFTNSSPVAHAPLYFRHMTGTGDSTATHIVHHMTTEHHCPCCAAKYVQPTSCTTVNALKGEFV